MVLAFLALVVALLALVKARGLSERMRRIESDRDSLAAQVTTLRRLFERVQAEVAGTARDAAAPLPDPQASHPSAEMAGSRVDSAGSSPVTSVVSRLRAPFPEPPSPRVLPTPPPSPPPPPPAAVGQEPVPTPIDWESLLGVKGAAWVGGVALITSAIFFARWTIEQGLVTPEFRFALMLLAGIGAIVGAEFGLRKGYERTANPLSGAGIAILYVAFFAGHSRYDLISVPTAFAGMVFVTITACVVAVRYDAFPTAVLGLLGGFATPVALSTGEDRPFGLFSYILLLNIGLLSMGVRRRWHGLFELGLLGTLLIQMGWFSRFMSPPNLLVGLAAFLIFGIVYLLLPLVAEEEDNERVMRTGALGGVAPFLFMVFLAGSPAYVEQWPLLFGMMALLDLAIGAVGILRGRVSLMLSAALATSLTLALWGSAGLKSGSGASILAATLSAIGLTSIFGLARRAALRFGSLDDASLRVIEVAALGSWAGLCLFGLIMIGHDRGAPAGPFLALAVALAFLLIERAGHEGRVRGALSVGSMGLAALLQIWFFSAVDASSLVGYLCVPAAQSLLLSLFASRNIAEGRDTEGEVAVRLSSWIAIWGLFAALVEPTTAAAGWPLFLALAVQVLVVSGSVLRSGWTIGLPVALGASAMHMLFWQLAHLKPHQQTMAFGFASLFYLFFLLLPMIVPFARWREALLPWLTSALAGPAFFLPLYNVYQDMFGESTIGLLPVAMGAVSVLGLRVVSTRFAARPGDALGARLRLRYLALFAAVALWFVAVAVPLQLDRQWITLGWALEALALAWLFGRLPHRGLPVFAGILYGLVGVRLLLNPEILGYQERGLPLLNWILYTYGIAAVSCLVGQRLLRRASPDGFVHRLADAVALNGLLLGFWLVNLEILDYFSTGPYIAISHQSGYSVKLALSAGWGFYAIVLLLVGVAKDLKSLRYLSLAFLLLTVAKVFLYDLSELGGIFRVFSFLGLAIALIMVSLFYQRFVFGKKR